MTGAFQIFVIFALMQRYAFELSYNGKDFFGWQRQPRQMSVQEAIETALFKLNGNKAIPVTGCGRTDTGVHAKHYVLHTDLPESIINDELRFKLNRMLPPGIAISKIYETAPDFHARFDAKSRTYRYFIHHEKDPFNHDFSLHLPIRPDIDKMNEAAQFLLGKQDFTSFSKLHTDVKTNICDVTAARWVAPEAGKLYFEITADRFLRNMVRATVGTLLETGTGKIAPEDMRSILDEKDRSAAKISVPGHALFLWEISY